MKRLITLFFLVCLCMAGARAQLAKVCFTNMPDSICPLLTAVNRADFIDFLESKMKAEVTNRLGGKSEMTHLSADYIRIKMTDQSTWQMKLLPLNDSTKVICTIRTACAPACDSSLRFYATDWKPLPSADFLPQLPVLDDFVTEPADTTNLYRYNDARRQADMLWMRADLSASGQELTFTFTTPDYMSEEAAKTLKPYIRSTRVYVWKNGHFE